MLPKITTKLGFNYSCCIFRHTHPMKVVREFFNVPEIAWFPVRDGFSFFMNFFLAAFEYLSLNKKNP